MKLASLVLLPVLAIGSPAVPPALAQEAEFTSKEARAVAHAYAECVVGRRPHRASAAVLANLDSETVVRKYQDIFIPECLLEGSEDVGVMRWKGDLYLYALADALVRREFASGSIPGVSAVPPLQHRDPGAPPTPTSAGGNVKFEQALRKHKVKVAYSFLSRFGECLARLAPLDSMALLRTSPDSEAESAALKALMPALEACMPDGRALTFGRPELRGTVAINVYRLAHAARPTAAKVAS